MCIQSVFTVSQVCSCLINFSLHHYSACSAFLEIFKPVVTSRYSLVYPRSTEMAESQPRKSRFRQLLSALPIRFGKKKDGKSGNEGGRPGDLNQTNTMSKRPSAQQPAKPDPEASRQQSENRANAIELTSTGAINTLGSDLPMTAAPTVAADPAVQTGSTKAAGNATIEMNAPVATQEGSRRLSCWALANQQLEKTKPEVHKKLHKDLPPDQDFGKDPESLMKLATDQKKAAKPLPRWLEHSVRLVLQFKDVIAAGTSLDPHKCAPIVWKSISIVLEVRVWSLFNNRDIDSRNK